ncbi:MAG: class I SAM-dependent DNA methyltransferase [Deferrisomatales bacterium]
MAQLENIEAIEKELWRAADTLRANSNYASNEYFMPVMGLIFLRHAYSRYLKVRDEIVATLPTRGGKPRELTKEDFSQKSAIFLRPEAQFDHLVALPSGANRANAIVGAMESIEADYQNLKGQLPKEEYQQLDDEVLGQLLRTLNPDELKKASGDIFGRIYEYFLTQFADQKAHDGGEFFTPVSLVSLIANVIEPDHGVVLDPACGSGGMFVQSAHFVERLHRNPGEALTFYGLEKNPTTIRLAKMNLAVHGLEGDIQKAITYYEDPHELAGKADFVMANPPFNVDEVDEGKVKRDPRLPFGLPGVNKGGKVSNGNYLWISYFYSYLSDTGRAGFVMSSQASSAGRDEAKVRRKLVETGAVDVMVAIRSNFFYTRTVPCELWHLDRAKPAEHRDKVLMLDARNVYRKVTRKIYDFSPEQRQNLLAIVWLYRGQKGRFLDLVSGYLTSTLREADACFEAQGPDGKAVRPMEAYASSIDVLRSLMRDFLEKADRTGPQEEFRIAFQQTAETFVEDAEAFLNAIAREEAAAVGWVKRSGPTISQEALARLAPLADTSRDLVKQADQVYKLASRLVEALQHAPSPQPSPKGRGGDGLGAIRRQLKAADEARHALVEQLKRVRYFWKQAHWLVERFPDAELRPVPGLVKLVDVAEIAANDWSLTPGRYVGVAPEEVDEDFDFEEALRDIHIELEGLNAEAVELAGRIARNFEELGV